MALSWGGAGAMGGETWSSGHWWASFLFFWVQKQQSFECRRRAFQPTQKSRRFHLLRKLDAIISVNHAAANHRNLHYNTLSCHAP